MGIIKNKRMLQLNEEIVTRDRMTLKEDGNAYVSSSNDSMSSLGSDINRSKTENPTDKDFVVDLSTYDGNKGNNPVSLDVNAKNGVDAQRQIQNNINSKPQLKTMMNNGQLNANVHIKEDRLKELRENSIGFTKKEITDILLNR